MNKVTLSLFLLIFYTSLSLGQTADISMTSSKAIGSDLTFRMKSRTDTSLIQIDFGDGIRVNKIVDTSITVVTGKVVGTKNIKIYGSEIIYFYCAFNQLTALDITRALSLEKLDCYSNLLTTLDVSNHVNLKHLNCISNKLSVLDVSNNRSLLTLQCSFNALTSLNVTNNIELTELNCGSNKLSALSIASNTKLNKLHCFTNLITELDISFNTQLLWLDCQGNKLSNLDVTRNTALQHLVCYRNQLSLLNISNNTQLELVGCSENVITLLDVTKNIKLERLLCELNKLSNLDLSKNVDLDYIACGYNQLMILDLSNNLKLRRLECQYNQIGSLNISLNKDLEYINCSNNRLQGEMDVSDCLKLEALWCDDNNLTDLHAIDRPLLMFFGCSGNRLTFSTIPVITSKSSYDFIGYSPQQKMPIVRSVNLGVPIDLNSQYSVNSKITVYKWKTKGGSLLVKDVDYTLNSGRTIFLKPQTDSVYCEMTNATFPEFSGSTALKTTCIKVYFQPFLNVPVDTLLSTYLPSIAFFNISSNTSWNITSDKSWLITNISSGMNNALVTLTVLENTEIKNRTVIITISGVGIEPKRITLIQEGIPFDPQLSVSADTIAIEATVTTTYFEVLSNLDWQISSDQDWLQSTVAEGSDSAIINLTATNNTGINARTANITVTTEEAGTRNIHVIQQGIPFSPQLSVSTDTIRMDASDTTSNFEILSNLNWHISSDQDWLQSNVTEGSDSAIMVLISSINTGINARTANITVATEEAGTRNIHVIQQGIPFSPQLSVSTDSIIIEASDTASDFEILSNLDWQISSDQDWLYVTTSDGSGNSTINLTSGLNPATFARTAMLTITGHDTITRNIILIQKGAAIFLMVPSDLLTLNEDADSTHTLDIASNIAWTVMSNREWVSVNVTSGSGNAQITVFVQSNTSPESRTAELTFSGPGVSDQTVNVVQYGGFTGLSHNMNNTIKVFPNPAKNFIIIENENPGSEIDELKLIDLEGQVVIIKKSLIFNTFKVDLQNLKSGTYILILKKGKEYIAEKVIVNNH